MPPNSPETKEPTLSRRGLLRAGAAGAGVFAALGAAPRPAFAQSKLTPEAALAELLAGNARYLMRRMTSFKADLDLLHEKNAEKQEPFAALLSCADSRVPVEIVFDQPLGQLFVVRVAGNVTTPEIIASLEYGAAVLGTKAILVLGHGNCGAVAATIKGKAAPGQISALYPHIRPAVDAAGPDLEAATRANAKIQAALLREASPVLAELVKKGALKIAAGYYAIRTGKVTLLS
ncbi:MAG TPA: carbonic anhydrase [Stellaceae bacterium]|nr:carbonic anhydrase [Stellaceae bacterium]